MHDSLIARLRDKNVKITPLLQAVFDVLMKADSPLSVEDLLGKLKERQFCPNKTSLYRQMEKLSALGFLQESFFSDMVRRYCLTDEHHHHFRCKKCGYSERLPEATCLMEKEVVRKLNDKGFLVDNHIFEVEGLCQSCN